MSTCATSQGIDNSGAVFPLRTRAGIDLIFEIGVDDEAGQPMDLTGYTAFAEVNDGTTVHILTTDISGDKISVHLAGALTAILPPMNRYSVEVVSPTGIRYSLCYGPLTIEGSFH